VQLAVYRLAWSRLRGVPLDMVRAAFYYVADGQEIRPHDLAGAEELERIVSAALRPKPGASPSDQPVSSRA